ncbi:DUF222 domain-containing protein [Modestobacter sp. URMC 112]
MGELTSTLDAYAAEDLHDLSDGLVLDRVAELLQARNKLDAELTRTVRHADRTQATEHDGIKTPQSWLRGHGRLSPGAASRLVHSGRALEHLPAVAAAFAAGEVTAEQMAVLATAVRPDRLAAAAEQGIDLAPFDQAWAQVAAEEPYERLVGAVQSFQAALDPDGPEPDPTEGRRLSLARHTEGGSGRFELDTVGFEKRKDHPLPTPRTLGAGPWGWPLPWPDCRGPARACERRGAAGSFCCPSCAPSSRTSSSPSTSRTSPTPRPPGQGQPPPVSARRSPPPGPGGWPAMRRSPGW